MLDAVEHDTASGNHPYQTQSLTNSQSHHCHKVWRQELTGKRGAVVDPAPASRSSDQSTSNLKYDTVWIAAFTQTIR